MQFTCPVVFKKSVKESEKKSTANSVQNSSSNTSARKDTKNDLSSIDWNDIHLNPFNFICFCQTIH